MKRGKIRVGVLFGGRSAEHEVSLQSATSIVEAIDKEKYEVVLIGIDRQGRWLLPSDSLLVLRAKNPRLIKLNRAGPQVTLTRKGKVTQLVNLADPQQHAPLDVIFPVLHGPFGEDGTVQGLLKLADIPYVGPDVLGSALGMDKDVQKRLLQQAGIPVADFVAVTRSQYPNQLTDKLIRRLGFPLFVKPANLGSSVGVTKAKTEKELHNAVQKAFAYDNKILVEKYIKGREIECSVLGNEAPIASLPGEVIPQHEFYSYEAKYIDEHGAILKIPAKLPMATAREVQRLSVAAFKTLCCEGMARADLFLTGRGKLYLNEINTIPGFTKISMYPKLWEASGITYSELVDRLITLARERYTRDQRLRTSYDPRS